MVLKLLRELATAGLIRFETSKVLHVWIPDEEAGGAS
jgi:hypothetical protein